MKYGKYRASIILMANKYVYAKDAREAEKIIKQNFAEQYADLGLDFIGSKINWTGEITDNDNKVEIFNKALRNF